MDSPQQDPSGLDEPSPQWNELSIQPEQKKKSPSQPQWFKMSLAALGGFTSAFIAIAAATFMQAGMHQAQLTGKQAAELSAMEKARNGGYAVIQGMGSYIWWGVVLVLGILFTRMLVLMMKKHT